MRIAVMSDTHDNIWKLEAAMPHLAAADVVLHCGDLCAPFIAVKLGEGIGEKKAHVVYGNNDGDPRLLLLKAQEQGNVEIHGQFAELDFEGFKVAMNHYPEIARPIAMSGQYDLVCYGHDHTAHEEMLGDTLLLNPGEVMGMKGRSSIAIVDAATKDVEWVDL
ncbi:MAG: metallophosphoesterase [Chloroflexi bacterium]|nr:MAG: metallophosphoesterase [Chloroflexota bacterium]MBL1196010.1 metallophosphoesterase [Chloroflexota bacterium]NOH13304.1 metallophosphoesterase [Chloroflexota bacterium]